MILPFDAKTNDIIPVPGEITNDSGRDFFENLKTLVSGSGGPINIDCSAMKMVTSNHVSILWQARDICAGANREIHLLSASQNLIRVLKMMDLADLFNIHPAEGNPMGEITQTFLLAPQNNFSADIDLSVENINRAMIKFLEYLAGFGISERITFELQTVFYEIATNLRIHVGRQCGNSFKFMTTCASDKLIMRFVDSGHSFDPTKVPNHLNPDMAIMTKQQGGLGLIMVKRMIDRMSYERKNGCLNILTLEKKLDVSHECQ